MDMDMTTTRKNKDKREIISEVSFTDRRRFPETTCKNNAWTWEGLERWYEQNKTLKRTKQQ